MRTYDNILNRIANTLMVYAYHLEDNGLMSGKTGVMLSLYLYARHSGSKTVYDFAGDLLDGLMKNSAGAPSSFENGLCGLAWCVGRLMRGGIIGGTPSKVLAPIDARLVDAMRHGAWSDTWNELLFFADRLSDRSSVFSGSRHDGIDMILPFLLWQIKDKKIVLSDSKRRAVLHYLSRYEAIKGADVISRQFKGLIGTFPVLRPEMKRTSMNTAINHKEEIINNFIQTKWFQCLFDKKIVFKMPEDALLLGFVEDRQKSLVPENLALSDGLAGLGTALLINLITNK